MKLPKGRLKTGSFGELHIMNHKDSHWSQCQIADLPGLLVVDCPMEEHQKLATANFSEFRETGDFRRILGRFAFAIHFLGYTF